MNEQKVYRHSFEVAVQNGETAHYHESSQQNSVCVGAIDKAILDHNYDWQRYDTNAAAKSVIPQFGADRVAWVLSGILQESAYDARFSRENKEWARQAAVPEDTRRRLVANTHPVVLDSFIQNVRKIIAEQEQAALGVLRLDERTLIYSEVTLEADGQTLSFLTGGMPDTYSIGDIDQYREFAGGLAADAAVFVSVDSWSVGTGESESATEEEAELIGANKDGLEKTYGIDHLQTAEFTEYVPEDEYGYGEDEPDDDLEP